MNRSPRASRRALWLLLAAGLAVRLPHLGMLPIGVHSWRQSDTAAIARNFHENGYRFAMPQVDWGGATPGYVESEFPLYPYTAAIAYRLVGVREVVPRALSVAGYLLGAVALYALVNAVIGTNVALWSMAFFLFLPLNIYYSRAIMPEAWMIACSVGGVFFFHRWTQTSRVGDLLASGALVVLAALLKLPALYLALPLAYLAWLRDPRGWWRQPALLAFGTLILVAVAAWYLHAHDLARRGGVSFGIWGYGSDKWGNWALAASIPFWNGIVFRSLAERWLTWVGFPLFAIGLFLPRRTEAEGLFDAWLLAILAYFVIVARGNFVHEYYQFPFLPAAVVYMGKVFERAPNFTFRRVALGAVLVVIGLLSGVRYAGYLSKESPARSPEVHVAMLVRECADPNDRIVTAEDGNPTLLYLSHRKGWIVGRSPSAEDLEPKRREGARCVAGTGPAPGFVRGDVAALVDSFGYVVPLRKR